MDLNELRLEIDKIDDELVRLFVARMDISAQIADYKKEHQLPILAPAREAEKLADVAAKSGSEMQIYTKVLYDLLFELSRGYQSQRNAIASSLFRQISEAISQTPNLLPRDVSVACAGADDPACEAICRKLFGSCSCLCFNSQQSIMAAVSKGLCSYGLLQLQEDSKQLYDQLAKNGLYIIRAFRMPDQRQYICISNTLQIYPGSDKSTLRLSLSDRPGALYKVLARLYTLGINVVRLESRAITDSNFTGMFYFDLDSSIYSDEFVLLMCELEDLCEDFTYLGSYSEVV